MALLLDDLNLLGSVLGEEKQDPVPPVNPTNTVAQEETTPTPTPTDIKKDVIVGEENPQTVDNVSISQSEYDALVTAREERDSLVPVHNQLKLKSEVSPFASDLTKKIDEMVRANATPAEINNYIQVQTMDVSTMEGKDVLIAALKLKHPSLQQNLIEAKIAAKYSLVKDEEGNDILHKLADLELEIEEGRSFLNAQKVNAEPQAYKDNKAAQEEISALESKWGNVGSTIYDTLKIEETLNVEGDEPVLFNMPIDPKLKEQAVKFAAGVLANEKYDVNEKNAEAAKNLMESYIFSQANFRSEIMKQLLTRGYETGREREKLALSGMKPKESGPNDSREAKKEGVAALYELDDSLN